MLLTDVRTTNLGDVNWAVTGP